MSAQSGFQLKGSGPELYENFWVPAQMGQCAVELVASGQVNPGDSVLDVGCGTGVVTREAWRRAGPDGSAVGADVNEPMLAAAREIAIEQGMPEIEWQHCDAAALPFENARFDVVLCQQGLQFVPDRATAVKEMARVLAPGGRLAVSVWKSQSPFGAALATVLDRHLGAGATASWQAVYSLGDRDLLRSFATDAGLRDPYVRFDVKFLRHAEPEAFIAGALAGSPLAGEIEKLAEQDQRLIVQEIIAELEDHMDDGGVAIPAACHTLTAEK